MIAERGVELHAGVHQWLVYALKLRVEEGRFPVIVNVVAQHQHELPGTLGEVPLHLLRDRDLAVVACPGIADDGEVQRLGVEAVGPQKSSDDPEEL